MADKSKNVVLNFKMDGQVKYAETLREINAVMNTAAKEYKNHISAMGKDAAATDKLRAEKKKLEIQMEGARKRTEMLRGQYDAMSKSTKTTTGQLAQMYGKLQDAERAESSLKQSLDRVNDGLSDQAQDARDAKGTLDKLKGESKLLEAEQKNLTSSFKLQNEELGDNATEAEKVDLAQKQLRSQMKLTDRVVANLEKQLMETKKVYGENSVEVNKLETKINNARTTFKKFEKSLNDVETGGKQAGDSLEKIGKKIDLNNLLEASEALQGVADSLLQIGSSSITSSLALDDSQTNLQANLGLTADEAEELNEIVDDVFRNGVVGSIDEATWAVILAKQTFKDLNNVELEDITNKITTIAKRTGTDVQENIRAADQMMIAFGLSGEEALDLIGSGYLKSLNKSGDFLDTLAEYAPHFQNAGYSADEMLQIINNGMENGALNTDKAADAVKEFQIKLGDGSIEKVIEDFSKDTQNVFKKWQDGKVTVADVATSISKDLEKMSPQEQQAAISNLSSQFEDLGVDGARALFNVGDAFTDTTGKAEEMARKSPGEKWESSLRELQKTLIPIGDNLKESLTPVLDILSKMGGWFEKLPGPIQSFVTIFGVLVTLAGIATPIFLGLAAAITALEVPLLPIIAIIIAVSAAIAGIILTIQHWGEITDWLGKKWEEFSPWLAEVWAGIKETAVNAWNSLKQFFIAWWPELLAIITGPIGLIVLLIVKNWDKIKSFTFKLFRSIGNFFSEFWASVKSTFSTLVSAVVDFVVERFNNLKNNVTNIFNTIKSVASSIWSNIKSTVTNLISGLKDGVIDRFNTLKSRARSIMQAAKDVIVSPMESARDKISGIVDKIKGFFSNMKLKIPKIHLPPMPHFDLEYSSKSFMGKTISYPTGFDVDWRADGAIFTRPTIFGAMGSRLQGAGEAGPEAALPLNEQTLGDIGKGIASTIPGLGGLVIQMVTPDKRVLAEMVVDDVTHLQERNKRRYFSNKGR